MQAVVQTPGGIPHTHTLSTVLFQPNSANIQSCLVCGLPMYIALKVNIVGVIHLPGFFWTYTQIMTLTHQSECECFEM